jgi:deoxyribodipyrimidine photolyase
LRANRIGVESYNGALLTAPWDLRTPSGNTYRALYAFKRRLLETLQARAPISVELARPLC